VDAQYHAFKHQKGHDLTGFENGTENPKGKAALKVGLVTEGALVGSSFVAVMPWADANKAGLMFVSFGHSFDAFEAQLKRMSGAEDGIVDGLFSFTRPMGGGFCCCPAVEDSAIRLCP
jgi:deferrochelatase/peroxidase EfeB